MFIDVYFFFCFIQAIDFLISKKIIKKTPKSIALILSTEPYDKDKLGEYLSEETSFDILKNYVKCLDFQFMDFDLALR